MLPDGSPDFKDLEVEVLRWLFDNAAGYEGITNYEKYRADQIKEAQEKLDKLHVDWCAG